MISRISRGVKSFVTSLKTIVSSAVFAAQLVVVRHLLAALKFFVARVSNRLDRMVKDAPDGPS